MVNQIVSLLRKKREGLSLQKISRELHLSPREKHLLRKNLKKLESQGVILRIKRRYFFPGRLNIIRGKFISSLRGYGFVSPEGEDLEDIFVPARYSGGALQGDVVEVLCKEKGKKGKPEGRVIRILEKGKKRIIGLYKERWGQSFFIPLESPSSSEIPLTCNKNFSPRPGMIVEVERDIMRLTDILGMPDDPGVDTRVVIQRYNLASSFSSEALEEARYIPSEIPYQEKRARVDYRDWLSVTIDGEKAQDFDDAVSVRRLGNGHFLLGVHIADVSHYVPPGSHLDEEAFRRSTSVYFPEITLPMFPERLSNNICSLRPKEEKLTFSVLLEIDKEGKILKSKFRPSLIRTAERMTYNSVYKIFEGDERERRKFSNLVPHLFLMRDLARLLKRKREREGSLDFDLVESELVYKEGNLVSVLPFERNEAHQVIEEFMVAANEAVASYLSRKNTPLIFRVHPPPAEKDLERLREILTHFGVSFPQPKKIESKDLQQALRQAEGKPGEKFISLKVLKSLKIAVYSEENKGHYGLAKKEYTHFTSPIRRYPDLVIHRILKKVLKQQKVREPSLSSLALHCSQQERNAEDAERELIEWRIFRFLKRRLGDELEGTIVDISRAGLVVEIDDYFVGGLVSFGDLGKEYYLRKSEKTLIGKKTGRIFELGGRVKVILASVDPFLRRINLTLSHEDEGERR